MVTYICLRIDSDVLLVLFFHVKQLSQAGADLLSVPTKKQLKLLHLPHEPQPQPETHIRPFLQ
jgi:hypothetical protein